MFSNEQLAQLNTLSDRGIRCLGMVLLFGNETHEFILDQAKFYASLQIYPAQMSQEQITQIMTDLIEEVQQKLFPAFMARIGDNDEAEFEKTVAISY